MISFIKGHIVTKSATFLEVEAGGIGYFISISLNTSQRLPDIGNEATILTLLLPKEDSLTLYGFFDNNERETFKLLVSVNGVGPKTALAVLSSLSVGEIISYVTLGNINGLQKIPGIGKKTAERMVLELKDKVKTISTDSIDIHGTENDHIGIFIKEANLALISLGYNHQQADKYVNSAIQHFSAHPELTLTTETLLKAALMDANK